MDYTGALKNVYLTMDHASKWTATGDSTVVLMGDIQPEQMDGSGMISIHAYAGDGCRLSGTYTLESVGKQLIFLYNRVTLLTSKQAVADLRQPVLSMSLIPSDKASKTSSSAPPEILRPLRTFA